jgi:hypothetical protein
MKFSDSANRKTLFYRRQASGDRCEGSMGKVKAEVEVKVKIPVR